MAKPTPTKVIHHRGGMRPNTPDRGAIRPLNAPSDKSGEPRPGRLAERLHLEGLEDVEVAQLADCALASLRARLHDDGSQELAEAIDATCDAWNRVADQLPALRT